MKHYIYQITCIILALLLLIGCGGGTGGSDGGTPIKLAGVIHDAEGNLLPGVLLTILQTGDSTTTDSQGSFSIETSTADSVLTIALELGTVQSEVTLESVPATQSLITIELIFDPDGGSASIQSIDTESIDGPINEDNQEQTGNQDPNEERMVFSESILRGTILNNKGAALPGVIVKLLQPASSTRSDSQGDFALNFPITFSTLKLFIEYQGFTTQIKLGNIPRHPVEIRVVLEVQITEKPNGQIGRTEDIISVTVDSKTVERREK